MRKKTVTFTGAGMSASPGFPTTSRILTLIIEKIRKNNLYQDVIKDVRIAGQYRLLLKELFITLSPGLLNVFESEDV